MSRALRALGLASFVVLAIGLLVQLNGRANQAYEAATPIRSDIRAVTVLFDHPVGPVILYHGWSPPTPGQGAVSTVLRPILLLPTSTTAGDVELTFVMASLGPRTRPAAVKAGDAPIGSLPVGTWSPAGAGEETVRFVVPGSQRVLSYQLRVDFDLAGADGAAQPIRIVRASTRILRAP